MKVLLITPPLTQLNTPYPATAYLTASLRNNGYEVKQYDLGIELINLLFTKENIRILFYQAEKKLNKNSTKQALQLFKYQEQYISTIDSVMNFLRGTDNTLASRICSRDFLPEGKRFEQIGDLEWAFGVMGHLDMAKYLSTLYIEDLTDFIAETTDKHFFLSRYAEKLCTYITDFKVIEKQVNSKETLIDELTFSLLNSQIKSFQPDLVGFSIPFPGNFLYALKCGNYIKQHYLKIQTVVGGGFVNTELRSLTEKALFNYTDYVLLDDGEDSLLQLCKYVENKINKNELLRTFCIDNKKLKFYNNQNNNNFKSVSNVCPDFSGLPLNKYISLIETTNPLSKIWSDGQWNKIIMAHGCYWAKCAFCDTSLPYIKDYRPRSAILLVNDMEKILGQTHQSGFHFVDEAMPPKLISEMSVEILKRDLVVTWWGNIRFEKTFNNELCELMAKSGCVAVSGGLETASDRLLKLMNKGVTIEQAAKAAHHLTNSGIMVHSYLMYGFPSQTLQDTVDSLEVVRQFFEEGLIQSAFWHRYSMTVHSPTGMHPEHYGAKIINDNLEQFARNDIDFEDNSGVDLNMVGKGLKKSLYNYMQGIGYEIPVHKWFEDKMPHTIIKNDMVKDYINVV